MRGARNNKGQVTIFIILAIVIVVLGVIIYAFLPQIRSTIGSELQSPQVYLQSCLEDEIEDAVYDLSLQGGSLNPEFYYLYDESKLQYLCYTSENYEFCNPQVPFLKKSVEKEIKDSISADANECLNSLEQTYKRKGYDTQLKKGSLEVELLPQRVLVTLNSELTLKKKSSESYEKFNIILDNNIYELVSLSASVVEKEASQGEVDILIYMMAYPKYKLEKLEQSDGTRVYIFTERNKENKFQFAVRSMAFPPGY